MNFLNSKKEYIVGFLDNERLTAINGRNTHEELMQEACQNFESDIQQIDNLYELIIRETTGKSTKKAYNELYNKTYLRDIEQKERKFEQEITNLKVNMGTVINSNYWRIEGIKNVYNVFQEEISEKFEKDLSEYQIEEIEEPIIDIEEDEEEIEQEYSEKYENENDEYEEDEEIDEEYYEDDDEYEEDDGEDEYEDDDEYDDEYDDEDYEDEYDDDEDYEEYDDDDEIEYEEDEYLSLIHI